MSCRSKPFSIDYGRPFAYIDLSCGQDGNAKLVSNMVYVQSFAMMHRFVFETKGCTDILSTKVVHNCVCHYQRSCSWCSRTVLKTESFVKKKNIICSSSTFHVAALPIG